MTRPVGDRQPRADHGEAAIMARRAPGSWVLVSTYPSRLGAQSTAQKISANQFPAYSDGLWQTYTQPAADGRTAVYVRYTGEAGEYASKRPQLSFSTDVTGLEGVLRADGIRRGTLIGLVAEWPEGSQGTVEGALQDLLDEVQHPDSDGGVDSAVERVEDVSGMDWPQQEFGLDDALRLRRELDAVIEVLARFNEDRDGGGDPRVSSLLAERRDGRDAA